MKIVPIPCLTTKHCFATCISSSCPPRVNCGWIWLQPFGAQTGSCQVPMWAEVPRGSVSRSRSYFQKHCNPNKSEYMAMDQYLLIPFLGGWTSIYQLFWCELQGYKVLTHCHISGSPRTGTTTQYQDKMSRSTHPTCKSVNPFPNNWSIHVNSVRPKNHPTRNGGFLEWWYPPNHPEMGHRHTATGAPSDSAAASPPRAPGARASVRWRRVAAAPRAGNCWICL